MTKSVLEIFFDKHKTNAKQVADKTGLNYPTLSRQTRSSKVDDLKALTIDQIARYFDRDAGSVLNELYAIEESQWQLDFIEKQKDLKMPKISRRSDITEDIKRAMDSEYNATALDKPLVSFMPAKKFTVVRVLKKDGIAFEISLINSYGEAEKLVVNEVAKLPAALFMVGAIKPDASGPFGDRHEKDLDDPSKEWDGLDELNDLQISRKWQNVFNNFKVDSWEDSYFNKRIQDPDFSYKH